MVTAIMLALVVSVTAAVALSLTFRRFELSAFRTDHEVAYSSSEAGLQYAFARLNIRIPPTFQTLVQNKRLGVAPATTLVPADNAAAEYVVVCHRAAMLTADLALDEQPAAQQGLHMGAKVVTDPTAPTFGQYVGGKHVIVRIRFFTAADTPPVANRTYRVRSSSNFGTGGP